MTSAIRHPVKRGGWIGFGILVGILVFCGVILTAPLAGGSWPGELGLLCLAGMFFLLPATLRRRRAAGSADREAATNGIGRS